MKVILNEYEVNGYQDSDFYCVVYDRENNTLSEVLYATTRASVTTDIRKQFLPKSAATEADFEAAKALLTSRAEDSQRHEDELCIQHNIANVGDLVEVAKGRKYPKGLQFTVTSKKSVNDRYGRKCADYLIGSGGEYINDENIIVIKQGSRNIKPDLSCLSRK